MTRRCKKCFFLSWVVLLGVLSTSFTICAATLLPEYSKLLCVAYISSCGHSLLQKRSFSFFLLFSDYPKKCLFWSTAWFRSESLFWFLFNDCTSSSNHLQFLLLLTMCVNIGSTVSCNNCKYSSPLKFLSGKKDQQHCRHKFQPTHLAMFNLNFLE